MASLIELDISGSTDIDAANKAAAVRIFHTDLLSVDAARTAFADEVGGPSHSHPDNPALRFDRLSIVPEDRGSGYRLTASYSTFGGGRFSSRTKPEGYSFRWRYSNVSVTTEIPANVRERRVVRSGDTSDLVDVWVSVPLPIQEYRTVWTLVVYTSVSDYRAFREITNQIGKLHYFGQNVARFASGTVRDDESRPGWYTVEYSWEIDTGTLRPENTNDFTPRYVIELPENRQNFTNYYRLPYESLVVIPSEEPKTETHKTLAVQTYTDEPDGWRRLPGTEGIE